MKRIVIVLVGLVLALFGGVFISVGIDLGKTPTCRAVNRGEEQPRDNECYDGSTTKRTLQAISGVGAGVMLLASLIPALAFGFRGIWLRQFGIVAGIGLVLLAVAAILGRI